MQTMNWIYETVEDFTLTYQMIFMARDMVIFLTLIWTTCTFTSFLCIERFAM